MKKKGSLAAIALVCSAVCLGIGLWFGTRLDAARTQCHFSCTRHPQAQLQVAPEQTQTLQQIDQMQTQTRPVQTVPLPRQTGGPGRPPGSG